ncbi:Tryprostatin B 6-hydroxylase [Cytospora mali]|uniref:Tryprostatin B 6-hydroxylase n=1 Tax=Cytospora mali TaxID=578113 RepID=A0A194V309_CYTMA|nr:Tryprostatin B 6-hydroxylase [Valsa mali var. pyri (nom. inval.)]
MNQSIENIVGHGYLHYLPKIDGLKEAINLYEGHPVPINDLMAWYAFDAMGEFAFNQSFNMVKTREWHSVIAQLNKSFKIQGWLAPAVWAMRLTFTSAYIYAYLFPASHLNDWFAMNKFTEELIDKRMKTDSDDSDISSWFIKEFEESSDRAGLTKRRNLLYGNSITLLVAGSDTTRPSLIALWYFLALYPEHAEKIRSEIDMADTTDIDALALLPHLNGFINESLRLLHPGPTLGSRKTPREGMTLDGTYIPGNVKILAPRYTISRLYQAADLHVLIVASAFEDPLSFIPERWYSRPEMIKDKRAFAPFANGEKNHKIVLFSTSTDI